MTLTFPKAGCRRLFTVMLSEENGSPMRLNKDIFLTDRFFCQRLNSIVFNCATVCCHLLNESGDLL